MLALARVSAAAASATATTATTASTAARTLARSSHVGTLPASVTACTYGTSKSFAQQRFFARSASTTATAAVAPPPPPPPPLSPSFASDVSAVPSLSTVVPSSPSPSPSPSPSLNVLGSAPRVSAEAEAIFSRAWTSLTRNLSAPEHESLVFPREIIWLNGAPGSGKTRNSRFMIETRGYGSNPIVLSDILAQDPACRSIIDRGDMVPDAVVLERLFAELLRPQNSRGALVDGFPRTSLQAECLTLLRDRMRALRATRIAQLEAAGEVCTTERIAYPEPRFLLCILYVGEEESIRRQLRRGNDARRHNARVREAGSGELVPERPTDFDRALIAKRYAIFQRHRDTLLALRGHFPFSVIDAEGPLYEVQQQILRQFRYQSDEELDEDTFAEIRSIPLAAQIRHDARDALVSRLDEYGQLKKRLLTAAVTLVNEKVVPACRANAFCGEAVVDVEENEITFAQLEGASDFVQMCVDVLSERGYVARHTRDVTFIPKKIDQNGNVLTKERVTHRFFVRFPRAHLSGAPHHHHHHHHHTEHVSGVAAAEADIGRRA